jgi:hypothetical protein
MTSARQVTAETLQEQYSALPSGSKVLLRDFGKALMTLDQPVETPEQRAEVDRLYCTMAQGPAKDLAFNYLQNWQDFQNHVYSEQMVMSVEQSRAVAQREPAGCCLGTTWVLWSCAL